MDELNYIISSNIKSNRRDSGGKAAVLAELKEKFRIPDWFVVTPGACMDSLSKTQRAQLGRGEQMGEISVVEKVRSAIMAATEEMLRGRAQLLAVRSSATAEDGRDASFAGQLESYLNVPAGEVVNRVRDVWCSAFSEQVHRYRGRFGGDAQWAPAVIVQRMVQAELAGVAFSVDPVSGNPKTCVVSATRGLADRLVSGEVSGTTYYVKRSGKIERKVLGGNEDVLDNGLLSKIIALLLEVEQHFGCPQDIEWAIEQGTLYLLQARPITTLNGVSSPDDPLVVWDNSNIVESYSGVTSALTFSFARYVYEHVYVEFCKLMGVSGARIEREQSTFRNMLGYVNGYVYYNLLNWYRMLALFPGFKMNRRFMEQMMGVKEPLPDEVVTSITHRAPSFWERTKDALSVTRTLVGLVLHQFRLRRTIRRFYLRLRDALSSSESLEGLSIYQLAHLYRSLERRLLKKWDAPLINDFLCMIAFGVSRKLLEKYAGQEGLDLHNEIMIGQGDIISAEPAIRIRRMAALVSEDKSAVSRLIDGDLSAIDKTPELKQEYEEYLKKFGDRCLQELKLESSTLHDDPRTLLQSIGHMARRGKTPLTPEKQQNVHERLSKLFRYRPLRKWIVLRAVKWAKARVRDRENLRFERTRVFGRVRRIFLEIGKRLHNLEHIEGSRDIFYLELNEVMGLVEGTTTVMDIKGLIKVRRQQHQDFQSYPAPPNRFEAYGASYPTFRAQRYATASSEPIGEGTLRGTGCCQGIVRGPVRVIRDPSTVELKPGEIMVAEFTDPGWITLFANSSGILVERGSLLSHSAIVAREMGIPAIVAIDRVTEWLTTGDLVEMNGATGTVHKIEA